MFIPTGSTWLPRIAVLAAASLPALFFLSASGSGAAAPVVLRVYTDHV